MDINKSKKIVTWQPVLTDHQAYTYAELSSIAEIPVIAYVSVLEDYTRKKQGWNDTEVTSIQRVCLPSKFNIKDLFLLLKSHRNDIHIFASPFSEFRLIACLFMASLLKVEFYLISEPYSTGEFGYFSHESKLISKFKRCLRPLIYFIYCQIIRNRMFGVFAISKLAVDQYLKAGISRDKIFPFGYFIPGKRKFISDGIIKKTSLVQLKVIYIGALIERKRVDLLINSVRSCNLINDTIKLDIYGPGESNLYNFDNTSICYCGKIPFGEAQVFIEGYDLLVLPSDYDGWGVVVNEAICAGVPVVCSDHVGAKMIIEKYGCGDIFKAGSEEELSTILHSVATNPTKLANMKSAVKAAAKSIQPKIAANYMCTKMFSKNEYSNEQCSPWCIND